MPTDPKPLLTLCAAATPSPWRFGKQTGHCGISILADDERMVAEVNLALTSSEYEWGAEHFALPENRASVANAELIARIASPEVAAKVYAFVTDIAFANDQLPKWACKEAEKLINLLDGKTT